MSRSEHWSVTVERNGERVITIEPAMLCGRDLQPGDEEVIKDAAMNLLGFIGQPADPPVPAPTPAQSVPDVDGTLQRLQEAATFSCDHSPVGTDEDNWCPGHRAEGDWCQGCRDNDAMRQAGTTIRQLHGLVRGMEDVLAGRVSPAKNRTPQPGDAGSVPASLPASSVKLARKHAARLRAEMRAHGCPHADGAWDSVYCAACVDRDQLAALLETAYGEPTEDQIACRVEWARTALASAVPAPAGWRSIESAPKDGTYVLLAWHDLETGGDQMWRVGFWHAREHAWCDTHRVLHNQESFPRWWQPLTAPDPPVDRPQEPSR